MSKLSSLKFCRKLTARGQHDEVRRRRRRRRTGTGPSASAAARPRAPAARTRAGRRRRPGRAGAAARAAARRRRRRERRGERLGDAERHGPARRSRAASPPPRPCACARQLDAAGCALRGRCPRSPPATWRSARVCRSSLLCACCQQSACSTGRGSRRTGFPDCASTSGRLTISRIASFCQQADARSRRRSDDADDEPRAELVEVLDEASAGPRGRSASARGHGAATGWSCAGATSARGPPRRRAARRSPSGRPSAACGSIVGVPRRPRPCRPSSVIESLNSRMPADPSWRPSPGRRLRPEDSSTMTRTIRSSSGPTETWRQHLPGRPTRSLRVCGSVRCTTVSRSRSSPWRPMQGPRPIRATP